MSGYAVSALIALLGTVIGLVLVRRAPRRPAPSARTDLDEIRARNAELESRLANLEARLCGTPPGGQAKGGTSQP